MSAEELYWETMDVMRDCAAWLMLVAVAVGVLSAGVVGLSVSAAADHGRVWEVPGAVVWIWWGCGAVFVYGLWTLIRRGFTRAPVPEWVEETAPVVAAAPAAAGPDLRLGPRRRV